MATSKPLLLLLPVLVHSLSLGCIPSLGSGAHATRCAVRLAEGNYMLQELMPAKAGILILTWSKAAQNFRADGFQPNTEAIGERAPQLKAIEKALPGLAAQANILALCAKGTMSYDTLPEPHASRAKRLSKTKVVGAISAGAGAAIGFVSHWKTHVSIDACAINPSFMVASEEAERALVAWQVEQALDKGVIDIRLTPGGLQLNELEFYASCSFHPVKGSEYLSYRAE
eukprot:CAMPEP_0119071660 /NCGR_PEP_ID=MMETSP1178-20130426/52768_1 /TAXON_ID=33656 /ORGANISM="unid sp, Strain CCMP2000" /LENGTH=227 /DNA_ID=CAMNT_0007053599 /DNA_START=33 /DNA_END=716 /DNA_ORIENTATION=+